MSSSATSSNNGQTKGLCLLSLDGGGVRGLSTLYILKHLMELLNPENPPKPCDYFDLIGGTSTGGLIAIMLGRLRMSVDECIAEYKKLSPKIFTKLHHRVNFKGNVRGRFDGGSLERGVQKLLEGRGLGRDALLRDDGGLVGVCRTFVCATSQETSDTVILTSYFSRRRGTSLLNTAKIWEAARATSAASSFFDPVTIEDETFVDGASGANNPIYEIWSEAQDIWGEKLEDNLRCLVSIGTGVPTLKPFGKDIFGIGKALLSVALDTQRAHETFSKHHAGLFRAERAQRGFRFNVVRGLEGVGLEEAGKQGAIVAATRRYTQSQDVLGQMETCAKALREPMYHLLSRKPNVITPNYCIPFLRNRRFVGRATALESIEQKFFVKQDCSKLALVGLGGVGKTQVALEFAYRLKDSRPEYSVFWVSTISPETIEQGCREVLSSCSIDFSRARDVKDLLREHLNSKVSGKWLLIIDNADDDKMVGGDGDIQRMLPVNSDGLVLVTTRHQRAALSLAGSDVVEINEMGEKDALSFLQSLIRKDISREESSRDLLDELCFLPLAIAQAAAYLNMNPQITIAEYLQLLKSARENEVRLMSEEFSDNTRDAASQNAVGLTFHMSFRQISGSDEEYNRDAADILSFISCVERKGIPRSILPPLQPESRMVSAIGVLCSYAFITRSEDGDVYDMHRLVHLASRIWVHGRGTEILTIVMQRLKEVISTRWEDRVLCKTYLPHVLRFLEDTKGVDLRDSPLMCYRIGCLLLSEYRHAEALNWFSEAYERGRVYFSEEHKFILDSKHMLAITYRARGKYDKAFELFESVLDIRRKMLPDEHPDLLNSQTELATTYESRGETDKAIELLTQVLEVQKQKRADENQILDLMARLAVSYVSKGEHGKALELQEDILEKRKETQSVNGVTSKLRVLNAKTNVAITYSDMGQLDKAIEILEDVVDGFKTFVPVNDRRLVQVQQRLVKLYLRCDGGNPQKRIENLEAVLETEERVSADRLRDQFLLATCYRNVGKYDKAVELLERTIDMAKGILNRDGPKLERSRSILAEWVREREDSPSSNSLTQDRRTDLQSESSDRQLWAPEKSVSGKERSSYYS